MLEETGLRRKDTMKQSYKWTNLRLHRHLNLKQKYISRKTYKGEKAIRFQALLD